ncbi:helix-turn-helix domain-containing protein [Planococcus sp. 4-30]|uniref:helix-turn-helix domain-containing protein n=1 Tax=Planococcus sp. 4-30 TaxID=2874583 RepID=UPI001CBAC4E3|nr:helix-turn-helix transcriptional regulator [Planococcus sp. 4-30]
MDTRKVGELIYHLRKGKELTQKQIVVQLNLPDRTFSKWERGHSCSDVALLSSLSAVFKVNIEIFSMVNCHRMNL